MSERLSHLDGLRGIAALLVVIHHFMVAFYPASYSGTLNDIHTRFQLEQLSHNTPLGIVINGGLAVAIFLLLSGYMAAHQAQKKTDPALFTASVIKRFFRFLLLILSCNMLALLLIWGRQTWNVQAAVLTKSWWWLGNQWQMQPSLVTVLHQSISSLFQTFSIQDYYNSSLWTMPLFFLGTIFVSVVLFFIQSFPKRLILLGIILWLTIGSYYYLLIVGAIMYEVQQLIARERLPWFVMILLLIVGVYFGGYPQSYATAALSTWYRFLPILSFTQTSTLYHGISAVCWLGLILYSGLLQRLLASKWCIYLGQRSFSIYVAHIVVINSLASWLFIKLVPHVSYTLAFWLSFAGSFLIILLLAEELYSFVESRAKPISSGLVRWLSHSKLIQ